MSIDSTPSIKEIADIISDSAPHSLSELYSLNFTQGNAPTSGAISLSNFRNKTAQQVWTRRNTHLSVVEGLAGHRLIAMNDYGVAATGHKSYSFSKGRVVFFTRSGNSWNQSSTLQSPAPTNGEGFGDGLVLSRNGNYLAVGSFRAQNSAGAAWLYVKSGNSWSNQIKITNSVPNTGRGFDIDDTGTHAIVTSSGFPTQSGATTYYNRSGNTWTSRGNISAPAIPTGSNLTGCSISGDGNYCAISATGNSATHVYVRSGNSWSRQIKITTSPTSVVTGLSTDGSTLAIGLYSSDQVKVYTRSGNTWTLQQTITGPSGSYLGNSGVRFSGPGTKLIIGARYQAPNKKGAVYIYQRSGNTWSQATTFSYMHPSRTDGFYRQFGFSVVCDSGCNYIGVASSFDGHFYSGSYFV